MEGSIVGYCYTCSSRLTIDDLFDHNKEHKIDKIQKIKENTLKNLENYAQSLSTSKTSSTSSISPEEKQLETIKNETLAKITTFFNELIAQCKQGQKSSNNEASGMSSITLEEINNLIKKMKSTNDPTEIISVAENPKIQNLNTFQANPSKSSVNKKTTVYYSTLQNKLLQNILKSMISVSTLNSKLKFTSNTAIDHVVMPIENTNIIFVGNSTNDEISKIETDCSIPFYVRSTVISKTTCILIGGVIENKFTNQTLSLELSTGKIKKLAPMKSCKIGMSVATQNDGKNIIYIYIFGGRSQEGHRLNAIERYHVKTDKWEPICSLNEPRSGASACCFNNSFIYIFGGISPSGEIEKSIEKLNIQKMSVEKINLSNSLLFRPLIDSQAVQINSNEILILGGSEIINIEKKTEFICTKNLFKFDVNLQEIINLNSCDIYLPAEMILSESIVVKNEKLYGFAKIKRDTSNTFTNPLVAMLTMEEECFSMENLFQLNDLVQIKILLKQEVNKEREREKNNKCKKKLI